MSRAAGVRLTAGYRRWTRAGSFLPVNQTFQVDLRGIVDLLSHHLYSSPRVYVRELMQNAVDAMPRRSTWKDWFTRQRLPARAHLREPAVRRTPAARGHEPPVGYWPCPPRPRAGMIESMTVFPGPESTRPARFPSASMSDLVDRPVRYDLAESTCPPLPLRELLDGDAGARLGALEIGYGTSQGDAELRALIAAGAGVAPGEVLVTAGGSSGMFLLAFTLCRPADHAVVLTPCFPPARAALDAIGCRVTPVALSFDDGYRLDVDAVAAALTPATRLVSLASPQNPSGVRFTEQELLDLLDRIEALAPQAVLLVDETYRQAVYGAAPVPGSAAACHPGW